MGMSDKHLKKYLGYKMYKINEDESVDMIRIIRVSEYNNMITYKDLNTGIETKTNIKSLAGFTPLEPIGVISFAEVGINDKDGHLNKDVIVSAYRLLDLKMDINSPYCICRQSVNDFFASVMYPDKGIVGVSVTRENCPVEIDYRLMVSASTLFNYEMVHIYYEDVIDDILECVNTKKYDSVLAGLQKQYIEDAGLLNRDNKASINGWCNSLKSLLVDNDFINDIDEMRDIQGVDFNIADHLVDNDTTTPSKGFDKDTLEFFRVTFKVPVVSTVVIPYKHDIDLAEFNNTNYIKMRDNTDTLYIVVYKNRGQYLEKELEDWNNKKSISDQIKLAFYNKYHNIDKK